jgi:hypothetical protein
VEHAASDCGISQTVAVEVDSVATRWGAAAEPPRQCYARGRKWPVGQLSGWAGSGTVELG